MAPIVKTLPSYIKESRHALEIFCDFNFLAQGLLVLKHFFDQRTVREPSSETLIRLAELVLILNCFFFFAFGGNHYKLS